MILRIPLTMGMELTESASCPRLLSLKIEQSAASDKLLNGGAEKRRKLDRRGVIEDDGDVQGAKDPYPQRLA